MKFKWMILFLFPLILKGQELKMSESQIMLFKAEVKKSSLNTQSLTADFVQTKYMSVLSKPIESKGKLSFKKPSNVLWKYQSPYEYSVVFKDNKVSVNDNGKKSDLNSRAFGKIASLILGSASGEVFDDKEFIITYSKLKGKPMAKLQPKVAQMRKYVKLIELYFDENTVSEIKMIEPSDDYTHIIFKNKVVNAKVDDAVFKL